MMTRDQAERLIERLADKTLSFGCVIILDGIPVTIVHKNYAGNFLTTWDVGNTGISRTVLERKVDTVLGHPIMLTDVLEKIENVHTEPEKVPEHIGCLMDTDDACCDLMRLWWNFGFTRSLQEILAEAEWEDGLARKETANGALYARHEERMIGPAKDLFEYLESLFPNNP